MSTLLAQRQLQTDLCIAGGGMSGVTAAIAAARNGLKVVLVQNRSVLGGNASSEIRMHICGADIHGHKPGARETGILEELRLEDAARNLQRSFSLWDLLLYEKVCAESNITLLLDTDVVGAAVEKLEADRPRPQDSALAIKTVGSRRRIKSVRAIRNATEEEFLIEAPYFADCTGDGRLGAEAGADFTEGREAVSEFNETLARPVRDKLRLGSSIMLMARDQGRPMPFRTPDWVRSFKKKDFEMYRSISSYEYGYWWIEWGGDLDTIKDDAKIAHECRRIALGVWDYIKNSGDHPGSVNYALDWVAPVSGKRESRRFLGPVILTQHDILNPYARPDAVAYGGWPMDIHPPLGVDSNTEPPNIFNAVHHLYSIPYGCLYSRNVENLFFAGRNISATHVAFSSTRVMGTCSVMGQAVGTAAALLKKENLSCCEQCNHEPFLKGLQQQLLKDDCFLPGFKNADPENLACQAELSGTGFGTLNGVARDIAAVWGTWSANEKNGWTASDPSGILTLTWTQPVQMSEIRLTFDTGLHRGLLLSGSDQITSSTVRGPQPECVNHYRIWIDGEQMFEINDNILRHRIHRLAEQRKGKQLSIECLSTHGGVPPRIFDVRIISI